MKPSSKPLVSLFMDVEDPINPLADEAALDLARLFTEAGVRGSFCVTGEKCRTLMARGRADVLEAYGPHALGLHTDTHSFHPTTMELLAPVGFEQGSELAYAAEKRGFESFLRGFGRSPACWGGAGNTWSPEITEAMKRLGIPAYVYALTEVMDRMPHRFNGVTALPQELSISETDWAEDGRAEAASGAVLRNIAASEKPYRTVFVGHPTKFRYAEFWDVPYANGRTPQGPAYAEPLPVEVYERSKSNLKKFLDRIGTVPTVVGVDDALSLEWRHEPLLSQDQEAFRTKTAANLRGAAGWPIHRQPLDAEGIVEKTLALTASVQLSSLKAGEGAIV